MDRHSEGYKKAIDKIWGLMAKNGCSGRKPIFCGKKSILYTNHVLATTGKSCANKKSTLLPNKYQSFSKFRAFKKKKDC